MHTDPISDMLTRIRNASRAGHKTVDISVSQQKVAIAEILQKYGFLKKVQTVQTEKFPTLRITLNPEVKSLMLTRKSKPGQRKYLSKNQLRPVKNGYGIGIISTSRGMMTTQEAREQGIGGEYICEIY